VLESGRPIAHGETLRRHVRRTEADQGLRSDMPTTAGCEEIRQLRRENFDLRRLNEIVKSVWRASVHLTAVTFSEHWLV
jgi:transposase